MGLSPATSRDSGAGISVLAYTEYTAAVTLTATTEAGATTIVTCPAVVLDGATLVCLEFFSPQLQSPGGAVSRFSSVIPFAAKDGGAAAALCAFWGVEVTNLNGSIQSPALLPMYLTPAAGSSVFSAPRYGTVSGGVVQAGAGGSGTYVPGYLRITSGS